jgi:plasmid stabilization system protein ParE
MIFRLVVTEEALGDTNDAQFYYLEINPELCERFLDELRAAYLKIQHNPQYYKYISRRKKDSYRYTILKSFPYIVIFRIKDNTVIVNAVFNSHRKPKYK